MAYYYIDPHTTTNGTGTWASPWSLSSTTRTGLVAGDELRIKGVALTSLLTATSYTATVSSTYQLTITAGGGLGADWAAGNIGYLPAYDTFFRVYAVATNVISVYTTTSMLPLENMSTTSLTVRKVDTTTYPASAASSTYNVGPATAVNNITVTDCWTADGTRVTDGSAKTLINSSYTSAISFYPTVSTTGTTPCTGWTVNLPNTAVMCAQGTTTGYVNTYFNSSSSTYTIGEIFGWGTGGSGVILGSTTNAVNDCTVNITHLIGYYPIGTTSAFGNNNTFNITNLICYYADQAFGTAAAIPSPNNTYNITNVFFNSVSQSALTYQVNAKKCVVNFTGIFDQFGATAANSVVIGYGESDINFGSSVVYYYNKRVSTKTAFTNLISYAGIAAITPKVPIQSITYPSGWTFTTKYNITSFFAGYNYTTLPMQTTVEFPEATNFAAGTPYGSPTPLNVLVTFRDGTAPYEVLGICNVTKTTTAAVNTAFPTITNDATVYRTVGPSLECYLATRTASYWQGKRERAIKTIKIPCVSGTTYTVSGYIRTDDTAFLDGDCRVSIYLSDIELAGQDMTTACENAWESFSLSFTASQTAEYTFTWAMYFESGAKSYWLDDLVMS